VADFLLELFSEEIPARMQAQAAEDLERLFRDICAKAGLACDGFTAYVTPRRLALKAETIAHGTESAVSERKGPRVCAPENAIEGFLRSTGLTRDALQMRGEGKDAHYVAEIKSEGQNAGALLKPALEAMLAQFPWPKSMRWGDGNARWVRPLRSILCLLHGEVSPIAFAGLTAGNVTYGHRFHAPEAIAIHAPEEYEAKLEKAYVIADATKRRNKIILESEKVKPQQDLYIRDEGEWLLKEVTGLVEWPVAHLGRIDSAYMDLPPEVLISVMRTHQRYFALENKERNLAPYFIFIANVETENNGAAVVAGNERVLRARLADGRFFWDQDRKQTLDLWADKLSSITFHAKLGSIADKVARMESLAERLTSYVPQANMEKVVRAVQLCKADLATGMVGEFPELQGVMGRYYALQQEEPPAVADAIRNHYWPLGPDWPIPVPAISICVALADKLDTLQEMFRIGEKPTGSKDPFALRRAALGVIRIILEHKLRLPLCNFVTAELLSFFHDRLIVKLREDGIRHDVIRSILNVREDDLVKVGKRAQAVEVFLGTDAGKDLLTAYRRACNILEIEEKKDNKRYDGDEYTISLYASNQPKETGRKAVWHENNLLSSIGGLIGTVPTSSRPDSIHSLMVREKFEQVMHEFAKLREPVNDFFDHVLVNDPDPVIRANRLRLLARLRDCFHQIADFSCIEGG
jgi:glycyl-tRNA synthetase beta chain